MFDFWGIFRKNSHHSRGGCVDGYPFDLDASLRHTRPATGVDYWPTHSNIDDFAKLGQVSGFFPQQDVFVWGQAYGKSPSGPDTNPAPINLQYVATIPGLTKQLPQY
jgi:hypothetical protein